MKRIKIKDEIEKKKEENRRIRRKKRKKSKTVDKNIKTGNLEQRTKSKEQLIFSLFSVRTQTPLNNEF